MKNNIEERVNFGIDTIDESLTTEVKVENLVFLHNLISELRRFWHRDDPVNHNDHEFFIGNKDEGVFAIVEKAYWLFFNEMLPPDLQNRIDMGDFDCPDFPYYYFSNNTSKESE